MGTLANIHLARMFDTAPSGLTEHEAARVEGTRTSYVEYRVI